MSLYRKYRPQRFSDLVGQEHVKTTLLSALKRKNISHAYLFAGPRGTGKTTVARLLAKSLNCPNHNPEPCNRCVSCKDHTKVNSLDLIEIDAASNRGIDDIRDLREKINLAPSSSPYKVFIIDEVHMLTPEAFNALLKTLEEPPAHAIFIMATTEPHKVPATVLSRCQRFDFSPLSIHDIVGRLKKISKLENIKYEDDALKMIAAAAGGGMRDAISIIDQLSATGRKISVNLVQHNLGVVPERAVIKLFEALANGDTEAGFEALERIEVKGYNLLHFRSILIEFLRKVLVFKITADETELKNNFSKESFDKITSIVADIDEGRLIQIIKTTSADTMLGLDNSPSLGLELAMVDLAKMTDSSQAAGEESQAPESKEIGKKIIAKDFAAKDWEEFMAKIKPHNHSLAAVLRSANVLGVSGSTLIIEVDYEFHRKKIEDRLNLKAIEEALQSVAGKKMLLDCRLKQKEKAKTDLKDIALEVFN